MKPILSFILTMAALIDLPLSAQISSVAQPTLVLKGRIYEEGTDVQMDNAIEVIFCGPKWRLTYSDKKGGILWTSCFDGQKIYHHTPKEDKLLITAPGKISVYNQYYRMILHFMGQFVYLAPQSTQDYCWNPVYPLPGEIYDIMAGSGGRHTLEALVTTAKARNSVVFSASDPGHSFLGVAQGPETRHGKLLVVGRGTNSAVPKSISRYDEAGRLLFQVELDNPKKFDMLPLEIATKCRLKSYDAAGGKQLFSVLSEIEDLAFYRSEKAVEFSIDPSVAGEIVDNLNDITFRRYQK